MTALLDLPPVHQAYAGGDPVAALRDVRRVIEETIANHPRSLQTEIGPSELGTPCDHCLAAKLAGWTQNASPTWLTTVGTAMHSWLEAAFIDHEVTRNAVHTTGIRYLTEQKVMVGHINGEEIWGSTDLLELPLGMTVDWKLVGESTMRKVKAHGPTDTYRVQADLYAKGWNDAGIRVDHVAIVFLPRNDVAGLDHAIFWTQPHDRGRAEAALARADQLARNLAALASISLAARDAWISSLPRDKDCFDCGRYPDRPAGHVAPGHKPLTDSGTAGLIPAA